MLDHPGPTTSDVLETVRAWVMNHVARTEVVPGVPICPYAKHAWVSGRVRIAVHDDADLASFARSAIEGFDGSAEMLMVIERDLARYPDSWARSLCDALNAEAGPRGLVVLYDHPQRPGRIGSVVTSNAQFLIFFVQERDRLNAASAAMRQTRYYEAWTPEYYEEVVANRTRRTSP